MTDYLGYRIVGPCSGERKLVDWLDAFNGYAMLDDRAEVHREAYLSAFTFREDFRQYLNSYGTTKGFNGVCSAEFIGFDIDNEADLERARRDAARLAFGLIDGFEMCEADLMIWFSGSKGFHIGLPTSMWGPTWSLNFNRVARRFAETLAAQANVVIDLGVYDKVRAFRAPNSRHPKTGLYKRALSLDELTRMSVQRIQGLAAKPYPFDLPSAGGGSKQAAADWEAAVQAVEAEAVATVERWASGGMARINRSTLDFIRNGAEAGDRHRLLFSAAANLAEFGCPADLAHELLSEAALDSGLTPFDVRRQIECGLSHNSKGNL